jgi:hypothetical protein
MEVDQLLARSAVAAALPALEEFGFTRLPRGSLRVVG